MVDCLTILMNRPSTNDALQLFAADVTHTKNHIRHTASAACRDRSVSHPLYSFLFPASAGGHVDGSRAGAHTRGETPDPIPNSEVKSTGPMIVHLGESRSVPVFLRAVRRKSHGSLLFCFIIPRLARAIAVHLAELAVAACRENLRLSLNSRLTRPPFAR